jgi:NAD(P)-dependent dehydrogenase (short-subunit alcohol dehydrogenase family)
MRFTGKVAIVTGSTRGIGRATAELLAGEGANIIINYRSGDDAAVALVAQLNGIRPNAAYAFRADVGDEHAVKAMVAECVRQFGRIDILVNNAGYGAHATIIDYSTENWQETIRVNLSGVFYCVREVVPLMIDAGGGAIVTVSSIAAFTGGATSLGYTASKAAVNAFTKKLAIELAPHGIRANTVAPGPVMTDMLLRNGMGGLQPGPGFEEAANRLVPVGHVARPEEIAEVIAFLCSDSASYITGECIRATGGL